MLIIPVTPEEKIRRIIVQDQPSKKVQETSFQPTKSWYVL
jgi:hypothetical protein